MDTAILSPPKIQASWKPLTLYPPAITLDRPEMAVRQFTVIMNERERLSNKLKACVCIHSKALALSHHVASIWSMVGDQFSVFTTTDSVS